MDPINRATQEEAMGDGQHRANANERDDEFPNELMKKIIELRFILEHDILICKAMWILFVSAAFSYRYGTVVCPFPPQFASEVDGLDISALAAVIDRTPKLGCVLRYLKNPRANVIDAEVVELLHWLFLERTQVQTLSLPDDNFLSEFYNYLDHQTTSHFFNVCRPTDTIQEEIFRNPPIGKSIECGFFGGNIDQFYYLINNSFPRSEPIILALDVNTALKHSNLSFSFFEDSAVACVVMCTYIDDRTNVEHKQLVYGGMNMPYNGVVIKKPELVRIEHLFLYITKPNACRAYEGWICDQKYRIIFVSYIIVLTIIGFAQTDFALFLSNFCNFLLKNVVRLMYP